MADKPDFGRTAADYARHRAGFPAELFERLRALVVGAAGQRVLDLGAGTGAVGRELARAGCAATYLDRSPELLAEARRLDGEAGVQAEYVEGVAESTGLPDEAFDAATAAVCWHWFDPDRAAREALRVLRPGGALAIVHFDWIATPGSVVEDTERLMRETLPTPPGREAARQAFYKLARKVKPEWVSAEGAGVHPDRLTTLARNGFERLESFSFDSPTPYSHADWRGRLRSHAAVGATRRADIVERFDRALAAMLAQKHAREPLEVLHRVFVVIGRKPRTGTSSA
ncbi:MAG: class I SAM-dependent methyltransferase [Acidobacteria bacterium]|nr:class I SAM-dependent methyltransferase [Acidobacteriota bacterium]